MEQLSISGVITLCVSFLFLLFVSWFIFKQIDFHIWKTPPGPIGLPLIGYVPFLSKHLYKDLVRLNKIYGKLCSIAVLNKRYVFVSDYATARELLSHPAALNRPDHFFDFLPGKAGVAGLSGKQWVQERRFAVQALRNVGIGKGTWCDNIREEVSKIIDWITSSKGEPIDICTPLSHSALRNIISLTLGQRYLSRMTKDDFQLLYECDKIAGEELQRAPVFSVFPWLLELLLKFNIAGYKTRKKVVDEISECFRREIKERLQLSSDKEDETDFILQYFSEIRKKSGSKTAEDDSVECLIGTIATFMNTSRTGMFTTHWLMYVMASYPEIQEKVHEEIDIAVGRNSTITWDDRKNLPYLLACILEVLRWIVIVPVFTPRCASESFEFNGYSIPQGTVIVCNGWGVNRDSKHWDDADKYKPERFLQKNAETLEKLEGYAPFSFGKRICPFEQISVMITFLYFAEIMQKFEIRTPSGKPADLSPVYNIVLEPKNQDLCFFKRE